MRQKVISIQYLRGLAALLVVVSHIILKMSQCGYQGFEAFSFEGAIGVDIFFIVSGYVMCLTTVNVDRGQLASTGAFLKRRFTRIFPMYWALTTLALVVFLIAPHHVNMAGGETRIVESFFLLPTDGKYLVKNAWTLTYELYFYIVFGASLLLGRRAGLIFIAILIATPVIVPGLVPGGGALRDLVTHSLTLEFLYGIVLYSILERLRTSWREISPWVGVACVAGATLFLIANQFAHEHDTRFLSFGIPAFFICFGFLLMEPWIASRPSSLIESIGNSSYSLYLIHPFVLAAVRGVVRSFGEPAGWTAPLVIAIMILASTAAGWASYVLFEDSAAKFFKGRPREEFLVWQYYQKFLSRILIWPSAKKRSNP